jgi:hypothetical protein
VISHGPKFREPQHIKWKHNFTTHFWKNHLQVRSRSKDWKAK